MLSDEERAQLILSPRARLEQALAVDDATATKAVYATVEQLLQMRFATDSTATARMSAYVFDKHGHEGLGKLPSVVDWLQVAERHRLSADDFREYTRSWQSEVEALIDGGDGVKVLAEFDRLEDGFRRVHDAHLDWFAVLLSHLYREYGVDELETYFRSSVPDPAALVESSIKATPEDRVRGAASFLIGNFGTLTAIDEYEDRYEVVQDPCGSCGRQAAADTHLLPLNLAVVTERHPLTFDRGETPVYRTHVAVLHYLLPLEQAGVPCPAVRCPAGLAGGPCHVVIYKDPLDPAANRDPLVVGVERAVERRTKSS